LENPGFETGSISPWSITNFGDISNLGVQATGGHTCPHYFYGTIDEKEYDNREPAILYFNQDIVVPDGFSNVDVSAWVRAWRTAGDTQFINFALVFNENSCGEVTFGNFDTWVQITCASVQLGAGTHTFTVIVDGITRQPGFPASFGIDDVVVRPVS
jgi:hypothetical protein